MAEDRSRVGHGIRCVTAGNGDEFTLSGTNTWIVLSEDGREAVLIDPGPDDAAHHAALLAAVADVTVRAIVLTHWHDDHSALVRRLRDSLGGVPVLARDPRFNTAEPLREGRAPEFGSVDLEVVFTPGHTSDSISLVAAADGALLTGDTFLGGSSTMLDYPDGDLSAYLESLERLIDIARTVPSAVLLPGHGSVATDAVAALTRYRDHRRARLAEVRQIRRSGVEDPLSIATRIYPGVDGELRVAAVQNVQAALAHLARENEISGGGAR